MSTNPNSNAANDPFASGSGAPVAKFASVGDTNVIVLTEGAATRQATELGTQEPKFFKDGNPIMDVVLTGVDGNGEPVRWIMPKTNKDGSLFAAIKGAISGLGRPLGAGDTVTGKHHALEPSMTPGYSPRKLYQAKVAPRVDVKGGDEPPF